MPGGSFEEPILDRFRFAFTNARTCTQTQSNYFILLSKALGSKTLPLKKIDVNINESGTSTSTVVVLR